MKLWVALPLTLFLVFLTFGRVSCFWRWRNFFYDNVNYENEKVVGRDKHFHCLRPEQQCKNGGQCISELDYVDYRYYSHDDDGLCYCPETNGLQFFGYDCGINVTGFPDDDPVWRTECPCENYCYRGADGVSLFCACPPDFFGEYCSQNRVKLECSDDRMTVMFNPIEPFNGTVYLGSDPYNSSCQLTRFNGRDNYEQYTYNTSLDHTAGCNLTTRYNQRGANISYTRQLTIQYDPMFQSDLDLVIDVTCNHLENGTWMTEGSFGAARGEIDKGKEIEAVYFPAKMIFETSGRSFDGTVYLGETMSLINHLDSNAIYNSLTVEACTFSNSNGEKTVKVIDDGCPTDRALGMNMDGPYIYPIVYGGSYFTFRAIRFGNDPIVRVFCRVKLCEDRDECEMPDCNQGPSQRFKRDVGDEEEMSGRKMRQMRRERRERRDTVRPKEERTISQTFTVIDPYEENGLAFKVTSEKCLEEPTVKSAGISLVAAVAVLLLLTITLSLCLCRMKFARRDLELKLKYSRNGSIGGLRNFGFDVKPEGTLVNSKGP